MFSNWLTSTTTTSSALQTNAPDVILEIGPLPLSRFAAHSSVLAAHSGYLRSVLRPEERIPEFPIYIPNVTAEHFTPLLTYMYTGFLDLNVENIFGVLLATHVLHMPRALEICRNFLARIQSDGYSNGGFFEKLPSQPPLSSCESIKVVRPIASKATNSGLAFIAPPISKLALFGSHDTPFKSINLTNDNNNLSETCGEFNENNTNEDNVNCESPEASASVDVDRLTPEQELHNESKSTVRPCTKVRKRTHSRNKLSHSPNENDESSEKEKEMAHTLGDSEKFIVDVASCDGPVRFQRVLNDAYGRYPKKTSSTIGSKQMQLGEHQKAHMTNSFHMQMARNISERQAIESDRTDSENSDSEIIDQDQRNQLQKGERIKCKNNCIDADTTKTEELYNCVYCKHTFKSQYCYQKHAKRHINPLSIESAIESGHSNKCENLPTKSASNIIATTTSTSISTSTTTSKSTSSSSSTQSICMKREVRPLDMNVQYYPCKTCGSKFPSYYFVHKHRKLCHSNEEN